MCISAVWSSVRAPWIVALGQEVASGGFVHSKTNFVAIMFIGTKLMHLWAYSARVDTQGGTHGGVHPPAGAASSGAAQLPQRGC